MFQLHRAGEKGFFVILTFHFVVPAFHFVIPALSRDPVHPEGVCKGLWCTLDPGSSPGMTENLRYVSTSLGRIKRVKKMGTGVQG
jgi:hypothetical protein